jgi:hypothetical protein
MQGEKDVMEKGTDDQKQNQAPDLSIPHESGRGTLELPCPHCKGMAEFPMDQINCGIARHGTKKGGFDQPLPPHAPKAECESDLQANSGCGLPFRVTRDAINVYQVSKCDFI